MHITFLFKFYIIENIVDMSCNYGLAATNLTSVAA